MERKIAKLVVNDIKTRVFMGIIMNKIEKEATLRFISIPSPPRCSIYYLKSNSNLHKKKDIGSKHKKYQARL